MSDRSSVNSIDSRNADTEYLWSLLSDVRVTNPNDTVLSVYDNGDVTEYTAQQLVSDVTALGSLFLSMSASVIAVAGKNSYPWLTAYLAGVCAGAAVLVIDPELSPNAMSQQIALAKTDLLLCDTDCYRKINAKSYKTVAMLDNETSFAVKDSVQSLTAMGYELVANGYNMFAKSSYDKSTTAHIAFDSGAYGRDKAVVLSQRSLYAQVVNYADVLGASDIYISEHLSRSRSLFCAIAAIAMGNRAAFCSESYNVYDASMMMGAQMLLLSPLSLKKYYVDIWGEAERIGIAEKLEKNIKFGMMLGHVGLRNRRFISRWLRKNGINAVQSVVCFGNNIDNETSFGIHMMGINLYCMYETPECGVISYTRKSDGKNRTLGIPTDGVYIKLNQTGQILVKADSVMSGYLGEGAYPDHWIPTGDAGDFSSGHIVLHNDPQKVFITQQARRIFPERMTETVKKQIPYASSLSVRVEENDVVLYVFFDPEFVKITGKYEIYNIVNSSVDGLNKGLSDFEQITKTVIDDIA